MTQKNRCALYGVLSAVLFGISGILASILFQKDYIQPEWLVGIRMFWSGLLLLVILMLKGEEVFNIFRDKKNALMLVCFGIFGVLLAQSSFFLSVYYGDAATATVLQSLGPTVILIIIAFQNSTWPSRTEVGTIMLALLGVFLLVTNGSLSELTISTSALAWGLVSAVGVAGYTLIPKPLLASQSALIVVAWGLLIGGIVENFMNPVWQIPVGLQTIDVVLIILVTLGGTLVAYALYIASLCHLESTVASLLGTLEPLTATLLSVIVLQLHLKTFQIIGIGLVLMTVLLISLPKKKTTV